MLALNACIRAIKFIYPSNYSKDKGNREDVYEHYLVSDITESLILNLKGISVKARDPQLKRDTIKGAKETDVTLI